VQFQKGFCSKKYSQHHPTIKRREHNNADCVPRSHLMISFFVVYTLPLPSKEDNTIMQTVSHVVI